MRKLKRYKPTKFKAKTSTYDKAVADFAVGFIECLCHTKGTWAGKPFELIDWQEQIIRDVFGDIEEIENLLDGLAERGFTLHDEKLEALAAKLNAVEEPTEDAEKIDYTISIPLEHVDCGKLTRLLEVKGDLIKKALGIDELPIKIDEEKVSFPWFRIEPEYGTCQAAAELVVALCKMSKDQKRITAQKKEVENEKYAFRCFLLRLGFIGKGYKEIRKTLLSNLSGNAAFKGGAK